MLCFIFMFVKYTLLFKSLSLIFLGDFNDNIGVYVGKRSPQENCTEVMKSERSFHHSTFILKYSCMKKEAKHVKVESKSYNLRINELEVYADGKLRWETKFN